MQFGAGDDLMALPQGCDLCLEWAEGGEVMREYLRPWKLATFAAGLALLIAGAFYYRTSDWDVGISLIMGTLTYITAPWALGVVKSFQWRLFPGVLLAYWLTVDGSYTAYNACLGHPVSANLRWANFFASSLLYLLCGWLWLPRVSLRKFLSELTSTFGVTSP